MPQVTIQEAQSQLANLIHGLSLGDDCVITEGDLPVAKLVLVTGDLSEKPRQLGTLKGTVLSVATGFDAPMDDFKEHME